MQDIILDHNKVDIMGETEMAVSEVAVWRKEALQHFLKKGYPHAKDEEYKYLDFAAMVKSDLKTACAKSIEELNLDTVLKYSPEEQYENRIVLANGLFCEHLSNIALPEGVIAGSLAQHIDHHAVKKYLGNIETYSNNGFSAENTARFSDGLFLYVPKGLSIDKPIHLLKISCNSDDAYKTFGRILIVAEDNVSFKLIESNVSEGAHTGFCNAVSEISIGRASEIHLTKLQVNNENFLLHESTGIHQEEDARSRVITTSLGGKILRNNVNVKLLGKNSNTELYGFYLSADDQQIDNHTLIKHSSADCLSTELYKGIASGNSTSTFSGKIFVERDAQRTNAFQSNENILLSDNATINTKPQLEIYADDVKCSHGATIGQLDDDLLFYLRSRGISKDQAQLLLINAFAAEVIGKVEMESVEKELERSIERKLGFPH